MPSPLTERGLRRLAADPNRPAELADGSVPGLVVRSAGSGAFTFSLRYRPAGERRRGGRLQRLTVGRWPDEPLATIRARAIAELDKVTRPEARELPRLSIGRLAERFLEESPVAPRVRSERRRLLSKVLADLGPDRPARSVRRGELVQALDAIVSRGAPSEANHAFSYLRRLFAWALERELVETNPLAGAKRPAPESARDRVLSPDEIRSAWELFDRLPPAMALAMRFRLVTLQRGGEVATMAPAHVSGDVWTIPAPLTKMKRRAHEVFLSPLARALLFESVSRGIATAELFFPSAAGTPYGVEAWPHYLARVLRAAGAAPFTPHDLRRTPGVLLEEAGFTPFDLSLVLGHSKAGEESAPRVTGIYLPSRFARRKRAVALAWDRLLRVILEGGDLAAACARERGEEGVELVREPDQPAAQDARRR